MSAWMKCRSGVWGTACSLSPLRYPTTDAVTADGAAVSILNRLRGAWSGRLSDPPAPTPLQEAESLLRSGGAVARIREQAALAQPSSDVDRAWASLFRGELEIAQQFAYGAATAQPYDVDSRIVHGTVRLVRHELEHATHEFDAVIEEFGAESDAASGRRAAILAQGFAPLDDLPASDDEWRQAAILLVALWRVTDQVELRLSSLQQAHPDCRALLQQAIDSADRTAHGG